MRNFMAIIGLLGVFACGGQHTEMAQGDGPVATVRAEVVQMTSVPMGVTAVGTTEASVRVFPGTRLMGRVAGVPVAEGQQVKAGDVLVRIEGGDLSAKKQQAESARQEARAVLRNAETQVGRIRNLHREKAVSKQMLDDAETAYARAQAHVATAEGALKEIDAHLTYATVVSPIAGVVVRTFVEPGDMAAPGAPVASVEQQHPMKVVVAVSEQDAVHIQASHPVSVWVADGALVTGRVETVISSADAGSRTVQVEVLIDNADGRLRSGMFARVAFPKEMRTGLLIPSNAVVREGQLQGVFAVEGDRVRLRWVRLGKAFGERVEVLSGLNAGERIAISGLNGLRDGHKVEVAGDA